MGVLSREGKDGCEFFEKVTSMLLVLKTRRLL